MKKLMILIAAGLFVSNVAVTAQTPAASKVVVAADPVEKSPVKLEELPETVKKALAGDAYKGWTAGEAFLVKDKTEYYEVHLKKEMETKVIKLNKEGIVVE